MCFYSRVVFLKKYMGFECARVPQSARNTVQPPAHVGFYREGGRNLFDLLRILKSTATSHTAGFFGEWNTISRRSSSRRRRFPSKYASNRCHRTGFNAVAFEYATTFSMHSDKSSLDTEWRNDLSTKYSFSDWCSPDLNKPCLAASAFSARMYPAPLLENESEL